MILPHSSTANSPIAFTSILISCFLLVVTGCDGQNMAVENRDAYDRETTVETAIGPLTLPSPFADESVRNSSSVVGWSEGQTPIAPDGFRVERFADGFDHPRWVYVAPNEDLFVVESDKRGSADRVSFMRDRDGNGSYETRRVFVDGLNSPFGMLVLDGYFYIANMDGLYRWPYNPGDIKLEGEGEKILDLPAGGYNHHWTRNVIAGPDGEKIYVSVGSASNVGEYGMDEEKRRACILEINPDGSEEKIFASGIRNPVGMDWNPVTGELWTAVNERDKLGDNLVPDYMTSV
ncbi:MAG TPA: PQQ-dependent sugar dehydrogenase, partial [Cryomorphaceae bacterium]|nr:PQQ-dependent sugar dehydrogenase [Cryomorphaceae bacterium]